MIREVAQRPLDDGLAIDANTATAEAIRDDSDYSGVRVSLRGRLAVARIAFHVDVNVGDPVQPPPQRIVLPRILGGTLEINGYPLTMVYAEKIITMLERGSANTRWRDFADIYVLCRRHAVNGHELRRSILTVAAYRRVTPRHLRSTLSTLPSTAQPKWATWQRRQRHADRLPTEFAEVLKRVMDFADPVLTGEAETLVWRPERQSWH